MQNHLFRINNARWKWRWLSNTGFWKIMSLAFRSTFWGVNIVSAEKEGIIFSVGLNEPDRQLWDEGFTASLFGIALGQMVIIYERPKKKALNDLTVLEIHEKIRYCVQRENYEYAAKLRDELNSRNILLNTV